MRRRSLLLLGLYALVFVLAPGAHLLWGGFEDGCEAFAHAAEEPAAGYPACCDHATPDVSQDAPPPEEHEHDSGEGHHCLEHCALCQLAWVPQRPAELATPLEGPAPPPAVTSLPTAAALPPAVRDDHAPRGPPARPVRAS